MIDTTLQHNGILLKPLTIHDENNLTTLANDPIIWEARPLDFHKPDIFKTHWFDKALKHKELNKRLPFTIVIHDQIAGSTSYYDLNTETKSIKIGYTWLHPKHWGTSANATIKYMLLEYAFNTLKVGSVFLTIDEINIRSQQALKKLGFTYCEFLPKYMTYPDGTVRDGLLFGTEANEWPIMKRHLERMMKATNASSLNSLEKHLYYYEWSIKRAVEDVTNINNDDFTKPTPISLSTIEKLLQHVHYYDRKTYAKISHLAQDIDEAANSSKEAICEKLLQATHQWRIWFDKNKIFVGNKEANEMVNEIIQFLLHQTYHLGQLNACLSFLGYKPHSLDVYQAS